jgi:hypothetical protein
MNSQITDFAFGGKWGCGSARSALPVDESFAEQVDPVNKSPSANSPKPPPARARKARRLCGRAKRPQDCDKTLSIDRLAGYEVFGCGFFGCEVCGCAGEFVAGG